MVMYSSKGKAFFQCLLFFKQYMYFCLLQELKRELQVIDSHLLVGFDTCTEAGFEIAK